MECVSRAHEAIGLLKKELVSQLLPALEETKMLNEKRQYVVVELNQKLSFVQDKLSLKKGSSEIIPHAKEMLHQIQAKVVQLKNEVEEYKQARLRVEMNVQNREEKAKQLGEAEQKITRTEESLLQVNNMIQSKEEELLPLKEILSTEPELEYEQLLKNMASVSFTRESLKQEKQKMPLFQSVQGMWNDRFRKLMNMI